MTVRGLISRRVIHNKHTTHTFQNMLLRAVFLKVVSGDPRGFLRRFQRVPS